MAGLIANALTGTQEKDLLAPGKTLQMQGVGYDPNITTVNKDTDTVSGQLDTFLAKDTPFTQRSNARVAQDFNARGLVNSSMAAGAAETARIDSALPIAMQDANTYTNTRLNNQAAGNEALQVGADATNKASTLNVSNAADIAKLRETGGIETGLQQLRGQIETGLQTLKGNQAAQLADIEASYKTLIQASDSAGKIYQQTMDAINKTLQSDLDPEAKNAAVTRQTELLRSGLAIVGRINQLDLLAILDFSDVNA